MLSTTTSVVAAVNLETTWLPKLPVPPLQQTMDSYLEAVDVAVGDDEQKANTRRIVQQFMRPDGIGQKLQEILLEKQADQDNWAYHWWLDDMYMNNDIPLPVNSNPGMVFPPRPANDMQLKNEEANFVRDVAAFIDAILDYKALIDRQLLPQDRALSREKGQPLCMAQYQRLFASYRAPGLDRDHLKTSPPPDDNEHIIVAHQGQFWSLEVRHKGQRLSFEEMTLNLAAIIESNEQRASDDSSSSSGSGGVGQQQQQHFPPLGLLTTANRRLWAQWRHQLLQDLINVRSLQAIESSSMIVCIDRPMLNKKEEDGQGASVVNSSSSSKDVDSSRALQMIHGCGSDWNSANRWFDKTVQFIFSPDGTRGVCYEHSPAEGIVLVQVIEKALEAVAAQQQPQQRRRTSTSVSHNGAEKIPSSPKGIDDDFPAPKRLLWKIDEGILKAIEIATIEMDRLVSDLDFQVFRFTHYGKNRIKTFNVSPDVYLQLMLQWTYFKLHGKLVATYESAATRRFQLGRVDNIRSASSAALAWVQVMIDPQSSDEEKIRLFYRAADNQTDVMVKNILGQGIDIHLLGLRELARHSGVPEALAVFEDPSYKDINHFSLSTSQIPTNSNSFMGYGPVVPDGYGCSYNPQADSVVFCASSFRSCETTSTEKFVNQLDKSLIQVSQLLQNRRQSDE